MLCGLFGCGKKVPKDVIQPQAMEDLLYDYHLATTLSADLPYNENYKKEAYLAYVFKKHHVTEAEFDSSMVWYSRHSDEMTTIYQNLQKRMETTAEQLKKQTSRHSGEVSVSLSGDTVDLWQDRTLYWLTAYGLTNKLTFDLKADTSFHEKDRLVWEADFSFLPKGKTSGRVVMGVNLTFSNDSTQGMTRVVSMSGMQRLVITPQTANKKNNHTRIMNNTARQETSELLSRIQLMRYRTPEHLLPVVSDSLATEPADTLLKDSLRQNRIKRPELMKR